MDADSQFSPNRSEMQPLSAFLVAGPMAYEQFLNVAVLLAGEVAQIHNADMALGPLDIESIKYDGLSQIELPLPQPSTGNIDEDVKSLGGIFYHLLTGKPVPETVDISTPRGIYPPEAKLTVEKLLGLHPSGPFVSVAELHASLVLMRDIHETAENDHQTKSRSSSIRLYLILSIVVLTLILVWILVAVLKK